MNPPSAVTTLKTAQESRCAGLRSRIRAALNFSRVPKIGFVERQISIHREYRSRQEAKVTISNKLQTALDQLQTIAETKHWSQRNLAAKTGIPESTFRLIKRGQAIPEIWLPTIESALSRLTPH